MSKQEYKYKIYEWTKPFPINTLNEMYPDYREFWLMAVDGYEGMEPVLHNVIERLFDTYKNRYPLAQDRQRFETLFKTLWDTYYPTFLTNAYNILNTYNGTEGKFVLNDLISQLSKGDTVEYESRNGTSAAPYNLVDTADPGILKDKYVSHSKTNSSNDDIVKRRMYIASAHITGEINNFINTFGSLFNTLLLDEYVENELNLAITYNKDIINFIIDIYNNLPNFWKEPKNGKRD